jgi:hypothetical protein
MSAMLGLAVVFAFSCGGTVTRSLIQPADDDAAADDDTAACPFLGGDWYVDTYCDPTLIGSAVFITQYACTLTTYSVIGSWTGMVGPDGSVSVTNQGGASLSCSGQFSSANNAISLSCTPTCNILMTGN